MHSVHCIFSFSYLLRWHWTSPSVMFFCSFFFLLFFFIMLFSYSCPGRSLHTCFSSTCSGSGRRRRGRLGCRNVSVFSGIKQRNAEWLSFLAHVIPLAYFSFEFEWLIHSGDSCAVVLAKTTEFKLATWTFVWMEKSRHGEVNNLYYLAKLDDVESGKHGRSARLNGEWVYLFYAIRHNVMSNQRPFRLSINTFPQNSIFSSLWFSEAWR